MKNLYVLILLSLILSCKKDSDSDVTPDFSGRYQGIISYTDLYKGSQKTSSDTLEVTIIKGNIGYLLQGFDTVDIPFEISSPNNFTVTPYENVNDVNSLSGTFDDNTITLGGNWRYTYTAAEFNDSSIIKRNYKFIGAKL